MSGIALIIFIAFDIGIMSIFTNFEIYGGGLLIGEMLCLAIAYAAGWWLWIEKGAILYILARAYIKMTAWVVLLSLFLLLSILVLMSIFTNFEIYGGGLLIGEMLCLAIAYPAGWRLWIQKGAIL